ncbi:imelysin family protein [Mangrovimonas sp. ST2L15]|uniref:imelysin family protein n=1 Tax=Mangrovimonas sp. ST2L15 TaxID=1645916 RepID=UPI0006B456E6|nr:imelysin family protein [Mangrovimonas sp. ST2L15]
MIKKFFLSVIVLVSLLACSSSDDSETGSATDSFDRSTLVTNWSSNIIIPAFQDLDDKLNTLVGVKDEFLTTPNQANLDAFRVAWIDAYKVWQYVEMFNIGKAEQVMYYEQMNIFPTSVTDIETNIANGTYDLSHVNNNDAVGFPAVDYLLYGVGADDSAIIETYTTNDNASGYKAYLSDVIDRMQLLTGTVLNDWTTVYQGVFNASTGNTTTSSVNKLTNDFIYYFEKGLRANKVGIPAGVFSTMPLPDKVEAYYHQEISKELTLEALRATQDFFNGTAYDGSSIANSYKAYLDYLNVVKNGENLSDLINNQINLARSKIQVLDGNFVTQINSDNSKMTEAYDELQKVVVLLKLDMVQALNISVDYIDADGD